MSPERRLPGELAIHPVVVAALTLWLVNDHVFKAALGGPLPGKLSDVASLIAFPVLPFCATELLFARFKRSAPGLGHLVFWAAAAAAVMASINCWPAAADAYRWGLGAFQAPVRALLGGGFEIRPVSLTMDSTDCWTLPAALVPVWLLARQRRGVTPLAAVGACGGCPADERPLVALPRGTSEGSALSAG